MADAWQSVRLEEIEPISVVKGTLLWRPVRRTLDIGAFGINAYVAPNAGDDVVEEHDEGTLGHEELYVVLNGRATFTLDGEELDAPAGTIVFIRDPAVVRHARADEPGTQVRERVSTRSRLGKTSSPRRAIATPATSTPISPSSKGGARTAPGASGCPLQRRPGEAAARTSRRGDRRHPARAGAQSAPARLRG